MKIAPLLVAVTATAPALRQERAFAAKLQDAVRSQERAFAAKLQDAVRSQDRAGVADLIRYPARVFVHLRPFPLFVQDRAALLEMYDMVFTPQLRCAIVGSRESSPGRPRRTGCSLRGASSRWLAAGSSRSARAAGC